MPNGQKPYEVYRGLDRLEPGEKLRIEHHVSLVPELLDLSEWVSLPLSELEKRRADSANYEKVLFGQLVSATGKWEEQAAATRLLDRAIEYDKTPAAQHSSNQWHADEHGRHSVSNAVYKMTYSFSEESRYDREKQTSVPVAWSVTWDVFVNTPVRDHYSYPSRKMAGQGRKRFTDKTAMEKYLNGRIAAYSHLFAEISPPLPSELARHFTVNGLLLPGYSVADGERPGVGVTEADRPRESVLERIAADRAARKDKTSDRGKPEPGKRKQRGGEL
jgi:hypothetical protein